MPISPIANALGPTNSTTSFSITLPATQAGDIIILEFAHRGTGNGTIGGTYSGPAFTLKHSQLFASSAFSGKTYYSRATGNHSGQTVTGSGLTNSCAAIVTVYRGTLASGDPLADATVVGEENASGNETQAEIITATDGAWPVLVVVNSPDLAVSSQACTSPGALTERAERLSTGGTDSSIAHASAEKATAGGTGAFTWAQTNGASGSWAYAIQPAATTIESGAGSSAGAATATAVGVAIKAAAASSAGTATASGDAEASALAVGSSAGNSSATAEGANASPYQTGVGSSTGQATVTAVAAAVATAAGAAAGQAAATGDAQGIGQGSGSTAAGAAVQGLAQALWRFAGTAAGVGAASAVGQDGAAGGVIEAAGSAAGSSYAEAVGEERVRVFTGAPFAPGTWPRKRKKKRVPAKVEPVIVGAAARSSSHASAAGEGFKVCIAAARMAPVQRRSVARARGAAFSCAVGKSTSSRLRAIQDAALLLW